MTPDYICMILEQSIDVYVRGNISNIDNILVIMWRYIVINNGCYIGKLDIMIIHLYIYHSQIPGQYNN